jgi:hypothetical protein
MVVRLVRHLLLINRRTERGRSTSQRSKEEEVVVEVEAGRELQNLRIRSREQRAAPNPVRFTGGQTRSNA